MRGSTWSRLALAGLLIAPAGAAAQDGPSPVSFTGSVTGVSDYTFRGISQTLEDIAIQGGITAAGPQGLYLGAWGSSLNFGEASHEDRAHTEMDVFGGLKKSVAGVDADLGFVYYGYPGTGATYEYDFIEFALGLSRSFAALSAGVKAAYSPDYFAGSGSGLYTSATVGVPLPSTPLSVAGSVGHQTIDVNSAFGTPDYTDWSAGASLAALGLSFGVTYVDTDVAKTECFGGSNLCAPRIVFSLSRGM